MSDLDILFVCEYESLDTFRGLGHRCGNLTECGVCGTAGHRHKNAIPVSKVTFAAGRCNKESMS